MFKLTIEDDEGKTTVIPVNRDEMTIGREEGNTIRLTERNVSRRHARLMRQNGSIFVEDLKSFTGVRVNGTKIASLTAMNEGDQVQIGDYKIKVKSDRTSYSVIDRPTRPALQAVNGSEAAVLVSPPPTRTPVATQPSTSATTMGHAATPRPSQMSAVPDLLPVPDPIEAQPTIPLRMLSEMDPAHVGPQPATPARLVVLTTELAGNEFQLDRASLVIGRTNENDVVLNHRSISRHHAKIVQDRDHFTIVDLQSANGVRVNGEDYERIELHAGDVVELGHVRVRFVGPAEHYVFDPLARSDRGRSKIVFALVGVGLAAGVGLVLQRTLATRNDGSAKAVAVRTAAAPVPATPSAVATVPAVAPAVVPSAAGADELLALAATQAKSESWDDALASLDRVGAMTAGAALTEATATLKKQVADLRQQVETERRSGIAYGKFDESVQQKNFAAAVDWYGELPEESIYKRRARPRYDQARVGLVSQYLSAAERFRLAGKCADLRQEIELIDKLDPHNLAASGKLRQCRQRLDGALTGAATARSTSSRSAGAPKARTEGSPSRRAISAGNADAPKRTGADGHPPLTARRSAEAAPIAASAVEGDAGDADALMRQARDAWLRAQCTSAIDLSRKAIHARPGMMDAYQVIAVCSCSLKDAEGATRAYTKLDDKSRTLVRTLCQRNGITVGTD